MLRTDQRVVTSIPLEELWDEAGHIDAGRTRYVGMQELADMLRAGMVQFVVADVGLPLRWIPLDDLFPFWRTEVKPHVVSAGMSGFHLEDFPEEYCYVASEWKAKGRALIVVLEHHH